MPSDDAGFTAMRTDVLRRLDEAGRTVHGLQSELNDRLLAFDTLLLDALHLGLDVSSVGEETKWVIEARSPGGGEPARTGRRFPRRRQARDG